MRSARSCLALGCLIWALVILSVQSGCTTSRELVLPEVASTSATHAAGSEADPRQSATPRLHLADVAVRVVPPPMAPVPMVTWDPARDQLARYVARALVAAPGAAWVARRRDADYLVEVDIAVQETATLNGQFGFAIGLEVAALLVGAGIGVGIGVASGGAIGLFIGMAGGVVAAIPIAVVLALIPQSLTVADSFEATVVLRRRADGVPVDMRRVRDVWRGDFSPLTLASELPRRSGAGAARFTTRLVSALRHAVEELAPPPPGSAVEELPAVHIGP